MCDNNNDNSNNNNTNQSVCGNMGYYADKSTGRGQLYLRTREEEPVKQNLLKLLLLITVLMIQISCPKLYLMAINVLIE